jgi:hypothetical protein
MNPVCIGPWRKGSSAKPLRNGRGDNSSWATLGRLLNAPQICGRREAVSQETLAPNRQFF